MREKYLELLSYGFGTDTNVLNFFVRNIRDWFIYWYVAHAWLDC